MKLISEAVEVRGKEKKVSKVGNEYLLVRVEDDTGTMFELYDPDADNFSYYTKGKMLKFTLDLSTYKSNLKVAVDTFEEV